MKVPNEQFQNVSFLMETEFIGATQGVVLENSLVILNPRNPSFVSNLSPPLVEQEKTHTNLELFPQIFLVSERRNYLLFLEHPFPPPHLFLGDKN